MTALHLIETIVAGPHEEQLRLGAAVAVTDHFVAVLYAGESPAGARAAHGAAGLFHRGIVGDDPVDASFQLSYAVRRSGETLHGVVYDRRHARVWQLGGCQWRSDADTYPPRRDGDLLIVDLAHPAELILATPTYPDISADLAAAERSVGVNASRAWARLVGAHGGSASLPLAA